MTEKFKYNDDNPRWLNFMQAIVETGDIDPTYYAFRGIRSDIGDDRTKRMLVGMLMFYDIGVASQLSEIADVEEFWKTVHAIYPTCRRGSERRHFRGNNGLKSIASIQKYESPVAFWDAMYDASYLGIKENFKNVSGFGDYFIWKYADYCDRVFDDNVNMTGAIKYLPKEPREGSIIVAREMGLAKEDDFEATIEYCLDACRNIGLMAPPAFNRKVGLLEIETCFCMYKHAVTGNDYVGHDIIDKHNTLALIGSPLSKQMATHLPKILVDDYFPIDKSKSTKVDMFSMF